MLETVAWVTAALSAALWIYIVTVLKRNRRLPSLAQVAAAPPGGGRWPPLSVIVPARNEAPHVEAAVRSLLAQEYPDLEVIVIDDRSTDGTGEILERLAAVEPRLAIVRVRELPDGWLGKNHAIHLAAERARGDWLLFTDADVIFGPEALARAVALAGRARLGHLVAVPLLLAPDFWERVFVTAFAVLMNVRYRLWELERPGSPAYFGLGAFNLVRREAYMRIGGHRTLAMEVLDDLKLGLVLRRSGAPQRAVHSGGLVRVRWQHGLAASLRGLVKNSFASVEWRWPAAIAGIGTVLLLSVGPAVLVVAASGGVRILAAVPLAISLATHGIAARRVACGTGVEGLFFPVAGAALAGVGLWSALAATIRGGIEWRGTRYRLDALRRGCVREADWPLDAAVGWQRE